MKISSGHTMLVLPRVLNSHFLFEHKGAEGLQRLGLFDGGRSNTGVVIALGRSIPIQLSSPNLGIVLFWWHPTALDLGEKQRMRTAVHSATMETYGPFSSVVFVFVNHQCESIDKPHSGVDPL